MALLDFLKRFKVNVEEKKQPTPTYQIPNTEGATNRTAQYLADRVTSVVAKLPPVQSYAKAQGQNRPFLEVYKEDLKEKSRKNVVGSPQEILAERQRLQAKGIAGNLSVMAANNVAQKKQTDFILGFVNPGAGRAKAISDVAKKKALSGVKKISPLQEIPALPPERGGLPPRPPIRDSSSLASAIPPEETAVNRITRALKEAKPLRSKQEALYSAERAKRVAQVARVGQTTAGEAGFFKQLGSLKGELPKVEFESLRPKIQQVDIDDLFNTVEKANITVFEKVNAKAGLSKILGAEGGAVPTQSEIALLSEIFPPDFMKAVLDKQPWTTKLFRGIAEVANLPRAIMASADLSAPLRQGALFVSRPKQFLSSFKEMFKFAVNEKSYQNLLESIKTRPSYLKMRDSGLAITNIDTPALTAREEQFMSNLAEKIPGFGKIARASNRAYSGFLTKLRADVFDDLLTKSKGLGIEQTRKLRSDIATFINTSTGRGNLGVFEKSATILNSAFFSPRLMASRLNVLNPVYYTKLDPFVRKEALKSLLGFAGVATTVLGIAKLSGASVGVDPRSADFGKIKVGNTRYDILGGFQQYIRLASQLISGTVVSSTTGREITLGEGYKPLTRKDIIIRFFESKESPVMSFATALVTGQTGTGDKLEVKSEVANRFIPMVVQDMYDLYKDGGLNNLIMGLPAPFGVGVQTYGKTEFIKGENPIGQPTSEIRGIPGLGQMLTEKIFGKQPLGSSKGFNVETYYDELLKKPKEEAAQLFDEITTSNPELAEKISDIASEREQGITAHHKDLKSKGVASGDRALAVFEELQELETKEEKAVLWEDYASKGIITEAVSEQLLYLLNKNQTE